MAKKLFPKLSKYQAVEESWRSAEERDRTAKTTENFGGLLRVETDPSDFEILTLIDAAFMASLPLDLPSIYPADVAKRLGQSEIPFDEYLKQLETMGLNVAELQSKAKDLRSGFLDGKRDGKRKARAFFELIKSEWAITDDEVRDHLDSNSIYELLEIVLVHADETLARLNARRRHEEDPKQKDKATVRECWDAWRLQPDRYKGKAAFARDMREKFPSLESQPVIERWCRLWERENVTHLAK